MAKKEALPHWLTGTAFQLSIQCNNDAFSSADKLRNELIRCLSKVIGDLVNEHDIANGYLGLYRTIRDSNGNDVGRYALKDIAADGTESSPKILR
jgi:hypothetical protein